MVVVELTQFAPLGSREHPLPEWTFCNLILVTFSHFP